MPNRLDTQYRQLLQSILDYGVEKQTRNGGTKSVFGYAIRHKMSDGFPLLTTKKIHFKSVMVELLWFLKGDSNIKYLVDNGCHIWDGDAYKRYLVHTISGVNNGLDKIKGYLDNCLVEFNGEYEHFNNPSFQYGYRPHTQEEFINKIKTGDEFAKKWGELGPIYGKQWRSWDVPKVLTIEKGKVENGIGTECGSWERNPIDQIANLINDLKTNPDSRRLMVSAWNVEELDQMTLPPCHYGFQVYTRELSEQERIGLLHIKHGNKGHHIEAGFNMLDEYDIPTRTISLMWNQRSVDTFLGLPFNIASYGLLLELIAKAVNMVPDELIGNLGDTHLYLNHIEQAKEQIERTSFELPKLNINTEFWPHEGGECGEGPLDAIAVFNAFKYDNFCKCLLEEDLQLCNYQSHPTIKAPLSN